MDKNCIEGAAEQGERAINREALVIKARRRKCSGCAMKKERALPCTMRLKTCATAATLAV
jgi:hypothetical protein